MDFHGSRVSPTPDRASVHRGPTPPWIPSAFCSSRRHHPMMGTGLQSPFMPAALPFTAGPHPPLIPITPFRSSRKHSPRRVPVPRSCRPPFRSPGPHPPAIPIALPFIPRPPRFGEAWYPCIPTGLPWTPATPSPRSRPGPVERNPGTHHPDCDSVDPKASHVSPDTGHPRSPSPPRSSRPRPRSTRPGIGSTPIPFAVTPGAIPSSVLALPPCAFRVSSYSSSCRHAPDRPRRRRKR